MSRVRGVQEVTAGLRLAQAELPARAAAVVAHYGLLMQTRIRARASGRPGPRAQTGDYRRSIALALGARGLSFSAAVGTNAPQAWRLEAGFVGVDSLGREYDQPALPHFGLGFDETVPDFIEGLDAIGAHILRRFR